MTTAFLSALTSDQLETLRGTSALASVFRGRVRVSTCPNTVVYSARVNQSSFGTSFAQVAFDGGSGTLADIWPGMRVLISHTNDKTKAFFDGRVRKTPTSSILYINETSKRISDNDYIFVIADFLITDKLGRDVSGTLNIDYDVSFRQLRPLIYNLKSAYAADIDPDTEEATFSFSPLALAATSGASISSWSWDIGDCSFDTGSETTQNIVITAPEGFRWIHLTVTDSGSRTSTRHIPVWSHGDTYPPSLMASDSIQVTADVATGYDASMSVFAGVSGLLDNTLVAMWGDDEYQDGSGSIIDDNILFIGRIRKSTDAVRNTEQGLDAQVSFTLESPLTQLARLEQLPYEILNKATPTKWGEIKNATIWRDIVLLLSESSTFLELHSLTFDSTSDSFLAPTRNTSGNILDSINDLAKSINAALQMNASGSVEIVREAVMLETDGARNALNTVATWTESDLFEIQSYEREQVRTVGRLKADGGCYNSSTDLFSGYRSLAPGVAQESGEGSETLDQQILVANQTDAAAKSELNIRAGHAFEKAQTPDTLTVTFMDGYHAVLIPSRNLWHAFDLQATDTFPGITSDRRWLLVSVQIGHSADGTKSVVAKFTAETKGTPGQTITQPVESGTPSPTPLTPPFQPDPAFPVDPGFFLPPFAPIAPIVAPEVNPRTDGNTVVTATASELWLVPNFLIGSAPDYLNRHPEPGATVRAFLWYPWTVNNRGALVLVGDDSTTVVYRTEDIFQKSPVWVAGAAMDGVYSRLRAIAGAAGDVYVAGQVTDTAPGLASWSIFSPSHGTDLTTGSDEVGDYVQVTAVETVPGGWYAIIVTGGDDICCEWFETKDGTGGASPVQRYYNTCGEAVDTAAPHVMFGPDEARMCEALHTAAFTVRFYLRNCSESTTTARSRYSSDYGGTFADPVTIASTPLGGFDVSRKGTQVLAGAVSQARKASAGGSYSDYGSPVPSPAGATAIFLNRFNFGSTSSSNNGSSPQYLLASGDLDEDDEALWKVTASGATFTPITPTVSGDIGTATGPECLAMPWINGSIIAAILMFDTLPRLAVSKDGGSTWAHSVNLNVASNYLRLRKGDNAKKQAFLNNNGPAYCKNIQASSPSIATRSYPSSDPIILIEPFGG